MTGAIYAIVFLATGAMYIGSARCLKRRWRTHRRELRAGIHSNSKLQRAWLKYGADAFAFEASMLGNKRCLGATRSEETKAKMRAAMYERLGKAA